MCINTGFKARKLYLKESKEKEKVVAVAAEEKVGEIEMADQE